MRHVACIGIERLIAELQAEVDNLLRSGGPFGPAPLASPEDGTSATDIAGASYEDDLFTGSDGGEDDEATVEKFLHHLSAGAIERSSRMSGDVGGEVFRSARGACRVGAASDNVCVDGRISIAGVAVFAALVLPFRGYTREQKSHQTAGCQEPKESGPQRPMQWPPKYESDSRAGPATMPLGLTGVRTLSVQATAPAGCSGDCGRGLNDGAKPISLASGATTSACRRGRRRPWYER